MPFSINASRAARRAKARGEAKRRAVSAVGDEWDSTRPTTRRRRPNKSPAPWLLGVLVVVAIACMRRDDPRDYHYSFDSGNTSHVDVQLLLVAGDRKSGASYVRQLFLDNIFVAPLDTHQQDHHNEPAMTATRRRLGVDGTFHRDDAIPEGAAPHVLLVLVTKDPFSWLASTALRPHPDAKRRKLENRRHTAALIDARTRSTRSFLNQGAKLTAAGGAFEVIAYEDALSRPEEITRTIALRYGLARRRGGTLAVPRHHTGDAPAEAAVRRSHRPFQRRAYYLDREYMDEFDEHTLARLRRHLDTDLEQSLGYLRPHHHRRRRTRNRTAHAASFMARIFQLALSLLERIAASVVVAVVLAVLFVVAPLVYWRAPATTTTVDEKSPMAQHLPAETRQVHLTAEPRSVHVDAPLRTAPRQLQDAASLSPAYFAMWGDADATSTDSD